MQTTWGANQTIIGIEHRKRQKFKQHLEQVYSTFRIQGEVERACLWINHGRFSWLFGQVSYAHSSSPRVIFGNKRGYPGEIGYHDSRHRENFKYTSFWSHKE